MCCSKALERSLGREGKDPDRADPDGGLWIEGHSPCSVAAVRSGRSWGMRTRRQSAAVTCICIGMQRAELTCYPSHKRAK